MGNFSIIHSDPNCKHSLNFTYRACKRNATEMTKICEETKTWIQNEQDLNKNTCELHVYWRGIQFLLCTLVPWPRQPFKKAFSMIIHQTVKLQEANEGRHQVSRKSLHNLVNK